MKPVTKVQIISVLKVCRNYVDFAKNISGAAKQVKAIPPPPPTAPTPTPIPNFSGIAPAAIPTPIPNFFGIAPAPAPTSIPISNLFGFGDIQQLRAAVSYFGNPCLDLFFRVVPPDTKQKLVNNRNYIAQLLPLAWSHSPLTTLKLICNLRDGSDTGKGDKRSFFAAVSWLHHNNPKTLACNLPPIAGTVFGFDEILGILFRVISGKDLAKLTEDNIKMTLRQGMEKNVDDMIALVKDALDRYQTDPDYRFLHDRVTDLFADCLKSDFEQLVKLDKKKSDDIPGDNNEEKDNTLEITMAGRYCPYVGSVFDCLFLLSESIAKKIFPRISYQGIEEDESEYGERAVEMLMNEVLVPLEDALEVPANGSDTNGKGYLFPALSKSRPGRGSPVRRYLKKVKAGGKDKVTANYPFPHDIIAYAYDCDELREAAELHWKTTVEIFLKYGKFKKCLAVCDVSGSMMRTPMDVSVGLGLLVSELSEEPWNGKVITFNRNPQMVSIQGDDLRSKCAFVRRMDNRDWHCAVDFEKVFDLILEVAVNGNLKPEQMLKRVLVFTIYSEFDDISANRWEDDYEEIQRKYKEKGYVVPHLVVWNLSQDNSTPAVPCTQPGVTMIPASLIHENLVELFLRNNGDIGPDHVMEAALSDQEYQTLVIVD